MRLALLLAAAAALVACGGPNLVAEEAKNASSLPDPVSESTSSPTGGRPKNALASQSGVAPAVAIPAALQGRWGLTPGDCTSRIGDAKGLLDVGEDKLRFYESVAVPAANIQTSPNSIGGEFSFTGEGQSWTKHQTLELREDRLVRTERNPVASFRYVRCE